MIRELLVEILRYLSCRISKAGHIYLPEESEVESLGQLTTFCVICGHAKRNRMQDLPNEFLEVYYSKLTPQLPDGNCDIGINNY